MASQTRWTGIWANYGRWWRTGKPGVLQSTGSQRVGHDWATEHQNPMTPASPLGLGRVGSARTARSGVGEEPKGRWWCQVSKSPQEWESEESLDGKWFRICSQYSFLGWPWYPKSENGGKRLRVATRRARGLPTAGAWRVYTDESFCASSLRLKTPSFWVEFSFERGRSKAVLFLSRLFLAHVSVIQSLRFRARETQPPCVSPTQSWRGSLPEWGKRPTRPVTLASQSSRLRGPKSPRRRLAFLFILRHYTFDFLATYLSRSLIPDLSLGAASQELLLCHRQVTVELVSERVTRSERAQDQTGLSV